MDEQPGDTCATANPCQNHGRCTEDPIDGPECDCVGGFSGNHCDIEPIPGEIIVTDPTTSTAEATAKVALAALNAARAKNQRKIIPIAFLLLFLLPTVAANRPILLDTCSFDGATDGTFSVPVVECALSTPFLIKKQQTIINEGTPRHELQTAPETRRAIVPDDILKTSNLKLTSGKGRCQNKNEGKNSTSETTPSFFFFFFYDRY